MTWVRGLAVLAVAGWGLFASAQAQAQTADLSITKTDGVTTVTAGGGVTYTITAFNAGPNDANGATVADTFPASLTVTGWTCVGAGGGICTASGSGNINDTVNLPVGGSVTYTVSANVSPSATGTLSNTATVAAPGGVTDPTPGNNSATDTDSILLSADLSVTKTDGVTTVTAGGSTTYTITASNAGPANAPAVTVADTFPAILNPVNWTCVGAGGGTCTASGSGNIADIANLPAGGSVTYTVSATISASATGTLSNTATVSSRTGIPDPNPANNLATDTDTISASADLAITKTDGVTTATPGGSVTYTITASNAGPSNATGATVADTFPAVLTVSNWTCVGAGGGTCTASGAGNINDTVNLPAGGSVTYTASATISPSATGSLSNTATVNAPGGVTDPTPGNNSATDTDTLSASADLAITKTDGVTTVTAGGSTTYTITASNAGPSNVTGATVADTFPAVLTVSNWTCVGAGGGTCTASGSGNINDTVNLPAGGSVTYTVPATISPSATGTLSNTATVAAPGGVTDPTPGNNSATDTDTINTPQADLSITKTDGVTTVVAGGSVTYTIVASNSGPTAANGATVADTFPAVLTVSSWTCVGAGGGTCTASGSGNINDTVNLPAGASVTYTATATISPAATGTLSNTATVTAPGSVTDSNPANNSATDTDAIVVGTTSTALTSSVNPSVYGQAVTFTATVTSPAGTPTGTVQFKDGATVIGTGTLSGGVATFTTSTLSVGTHPITAVYQGNGPFLPSTSPVVNQAVQVPPDSLKLRALQISVTPRVAQTSGMAITGAVDAAIADGFNDGCGGALFTPSASGLRVNLMADPQCSSSPGAQAALSSRWDDITRRGGDPLSGGGTATAYAPAQKSPSAIDDAFAAVDRRAMATKAPPMKLREPREWLAWAEIRGTGWQVDPTPTRPDIRGTQVNAIFGVTRKLSPTFLVGLIGGYEHFNYTSDTLTGRLKGDGWTVGAYLGWKLVEGLRFDASVARSGIEFNGVAGTAAGTFAGQRWLGSTGLTGTYKFGAFELEPSAKVYALWEHENAYTDSLGTLQDARNFMTGRAAGGAKLAYNWLYSPALTVTPFVGLYADYYFTKDDAAAVLQPTVQIHGWSARAMGGLAFATPDQTRVMIGGELGGLGNEFLVWSLRGRASLTFGAK